MLRFLTQAPNLLAICWVSRLGQLTELLPGFSPEAAEMSFADATLRAVRGVVDIVGGPRAAEDFPPQQYACSTVSQTKWGSDLALRTARRPCVVVERSTKAKKHLSFSTARFKLPAPAGPTVSAAAQ